MRRSAGEVIRNLEMRIARLERRAKIDTSDNFLDRLLGRTLNQHFEKALKAVGAKDIKINLESPATKRVVGQNEILSVYGSEMVDRKAEVEGKISFTIGLSYDLPVFFTKTPSMSRGPKGYEIYIGSTVRRKSLIGLLRVNEDGKVQGLDLAKDFAKTIDVYKSNNRRSSTRRLR